jgi:uncharacterized protein YegP (UPF0339 family)
MSNITYPCYWEKRDNSGHWYWIYHAKNGEEIARSSESYVHRSDCTHSIELIKNSSSHKVYYTE